MFSNIVKAKVSGSVFVVAVTPLIFSLTYLFLAVSLYS